MTLYVPETFAQDCMSSSVEESGRVTSVKKLITVHRGCREAGSLVFDKRRAADAVGSETGRQMIDVSMILCSL